MPYSVEWVEPDLVVQEGDVSVYRTYRNDEVGQGESTYHFVTDATWVEGDGGPVYFDVRDISSWRYRSGEGPDAIIGVLREAIERGELTSEGIVSVES